MIKKDLKIDWDKVSEFVLKMERITPLSSKTIIDSVANSIKKAQKISKPLALISKKSLRVSETGSIILDNAVELSGKAVGAYIKDAEDVCVFLVTLGDAIDTEASGLMKSADSLDGYILDRVGSVAIEAIAESLEDHIRKECEANNKSVSMRLSPGYCDWPVEEQVKLDNLLNSSKIGVHLTESCMMIPRKTISGLIAIGPKELFSKRLSQCSICKLKSCDYRRA